MIHKGKNSATKLQKLKNIAFHNTKKLVNLHPIFTIQMQRISRYIISALPALVLTGCFTGIEGTPKITSSDVKKEKILTTPEQEFMSDLKYEAPAEWRTGKRFYICDPKIRLVLGTTTPLDTVGLKGKDGIFQGR